MTPAPNRSSLREWFEARYGLEPSPGKSWEQLEGDLALCEREAVTARRRLFVRGVWEARREIALRLWTAPGEQP